MSNQGHPTDEQLLALYRTMQVIRQTEEELARCHQRGLIHGACHTYVGQEAIAAGVCAHLAARDSVFSTHRGHGHALAKGMPPRELIAELFGKAMGCSRGRGGSMHLFAPEIGMMGTSGIVGPCILQACGGGYSSKLLQNGTVGVAFFGDGTVNNGAFHEGLNMASIWKLPVLFVCENNLYAMGTALELSESEIDIHLKAQSYRLPAEVVDGMDVVAVEAAARRATAAIRAGEGPQFLECRTYRFRAHSMFDAELYREKAEVEEWKKHGPILRFGAWLRENDILHDTEMQAIETEVAAEVDAAVAFAEAGTWEAVDDLTKDVYAEPAR